MKQHFGNLGLMFVLVGLLALPIWGYSSLMRIESNVQVLSEQDVRENLMNKDFNYEFKKVDVKDSVVESTISSDEIVDEEVSEIEFNPSDYDPAQADFYLD